jgi:anti-sigma regulatory factor (Ser/Thr protein kinase)
VSELNATLDLPLSTAAPTAARKAIRLMLEAWRMTDPVWLDDAEVVVGELVTTAVRHGEGGIELSLQAHEGQVLIKATDGLSVIPRRAEPGLGGGFELRLIEAFSVAWGVAEFQGGKRVWVRLRPYPGGLGPADQER